MLSWLGCVLYLYHDGKQIHHIHLTNFSFSHKSGSTLTAQGITSKALLLGFAPGQILSLDRRFLDPRRPVLAPGKKPTAAEAAEGE